MGMGDMADKAKGLLGDNADKIADAVDKVTDVIDEKTGGKFSAQLENVDDKARELLGDDKPGEPTA